MLPLAARAQQPDSAAGEIAGTVYDSVARLPVMGAHVQVVPAHAPSSPIVSAMSDAKGRYQIRGLKPGRYLITFEHAALDSLALTSPLGAVDVGAARRTERDLAVPSPATILVATCGAVGAEPSALLLGTLRDARRGAILDSGAVHVRWQEMVIRAGSVSVKQEGASADVRQGWYAVCGVPGGSDVIVVATSGADSTGLVELTLPAHGVLRRAFLLGGRATLMGSVSTERGAPLPNARVGIAGLERGVLTDSAGAFALRDVRAGSQTLEIRALGYAPEYRRIDLAPERDTTVRVTLTSVKRVLDTIRVMGQRVYSMDSNGFLRRQRAGSGHFVDEETVRRRRPLDVLELLRSIPSVRVESQGFSRAPVMRDTRGEDCIPAFFLNGARLPEDLLADLDMLVRPDELAGMEIYRGPTAPPQYSTLNGCGAIVIWTRPPRRGR